MVSVICLKLCTFDSNKEIITNFKTVRCGVRIKIKKPFMLFIYNAIQFIIVIPTGLFFFSYRAFYQHFIRQSADSPVRD
jgi:hypothetical protein